MFMKAILIDPFERAASEVEIGVNGAYFDQARDLVGASCLDVVQADRYFGGQGGAMLLVDDEGMLIEPEFQAYTLVGPKPIAGRFVIVREVSDPDSEDGGKIVGVDFSTDDVYGKVRFVSAAFAMAALEMESQRSAALYASHGLHVESLGKGTLLVTPHDPSKT